MSTSGMGGGGKSVNLELNLVPFIDLFSTLICFLLMTAAWQELDSMQNNVPPKAASEMPDEPQAAPPPNQPKKVMLTLVLNVESTDLFEDDKKTSIPNLGGAPNLDTLKADLQSWKQRFPRSQRCDPRDR